MRRVFSSSSSRTKPESVCAVTVLLLRAVTLFLVCAVTVLFLRCYLALSIGILLLFAGVTVWNVFARRIGIARCEAAPTSALKGARPTEPTEERASVMVEFILSSNFFISSKG